MKLFLTLAVILTSIGAAQAAVPFTILEAIRHPGFEPNPTTTHFYVQDDGKMTLEITSQRGGTKSVQLGTLSEQAVRGLIKQVNYISVDAKLVDPNEGSPMCTDAPSHETAVFVKGVRKVISRNSGCHTWGLESEEGSALVGFASVFEQM